MSLEMTPFDRPHLTRYSCNSQLQLHATLVKHCMLYARTVRLSVVAVHVVITRCGISTGRLQQKYNGDTLQISILTV